jgi:putative membrane protein insertion efficiency factor
VSADKSPRRSGETGAKPRRSRAAGRGRRNLWIALAVLACLVAYDWSRPPAAQWTVRFELAAIARYQAWLSPVLARAGARCRFRPSCSRYAAAVLERDGALAGNARAAWRVLRCAPWTPAGTADPP